LIAVVLLLVCKLMAQSLMTDSLLTYWKSINADYVAFDVREDNPVAEIAVPCFYTSPDDAVLWVDSLREKTPLLIICHNGFLAQTTANRIAANGYPANQLWYAGFNQLVSHRRSALDTLHKYLLSPLAVLPSSIDAYQLRSIMLGKRNAKVVDVRTATEARSGMVPGACNLDWNSGEFSTKAAGCMNVSQDILIYCASGNRAGQARTWLINNLGFDPSKVINMGGYSTLWVNKGLSVTSVPAIICQCLAVEKNILKKTVGVLSIYAQPNPFNSSVMLKFSEAGTESAQLNVFNVRGEHVFKKAFNNGFPVAGFVWNAYGIASGLYIVKISHGERRLLEQRLIKF